MLQTRIDRVQAAAGRAISQRSLASPTRIYGRTPGRIGRHTQDVFDDVGATDETPETEANRRLAIAEDIPGDANARLEAFVVGVDQRARQTGGVSLISAHQAA